MRLLPRDIATLCFALTGALYGGGVARDVQAQSMGAQRVLPIRQESLIRAAAAEPAQWIEGVSLSPTGAFAVYGMLRCSAAPGMLQPGCVPGGTLLVDVMNGRSTLVEAFRHRGGFGLDMQWSRDGQEFAAVHVSGDTLTLSRWAVRSTDKVQKIVFAGAESPLRPSERLVAWRWLSDRAQLVIGVAADTSRRRVQPERKPGFAWFASRENALVDSLLRVAAANAPSQMRLAVVNLRTRTQQTVATGRHTLYSGVLREPGYEPPEEWGRSTDGSFLFVKSLNPMPSRPITGSNRKEQVDLRLLASGVPAVKAEYGVRGDLYKLNLETYELQPLFENRPGRIGSVAEIPGASHELAIVEQDLRLGGSIYLAGWGNLQRVSARGASQVVTPGVGNRTVVASSDREGIVYHIDDQQAECAIYEVDTRRGSRTRISPEGLSACEASVSADGKTVVAALENVSTPPHLHRWKSTTRRWERIGHEPLADSQRVLGLSSPEFVTWWSGDGRFEISGVLVKPHQFNPRERYPLIVFTQGGSPGVTGVTKNYYRPSASLLACGGVLAGALANEGYLVLRTNHRGSTRIGLGQERYQFGRYGDHVELDIGAGIDWLAAKGWIDPTNVGICGHSMGGAEVAYGIANTRRFNAAVASDPFFLSELLIPRIGVSGRDASFRYERYRRVFASDPVETPWADPFKMRVPLLMRWSNPDADPTAARLGLQYDGEIQRLHQLEKLTYALEKNAVPYEMIVDADRHGVANLEYGIEWNSRVLQWFDYFLLKKGENPLPAMKSPIDYSKQLKKLKRATDTTDTQ
jgi:dipeptidyl aminopeptidase/acylaminoacyl peptidase